MRGTVCRQKKGEILHQTAEPAEQAGLGRRSGYAQLQALGALKYGCWL